MLNLISIFFRKSGLKDAAKRTLLEECGVQLGPMGHQLLDQAATQVSRNAGNSYDAAAAVLVGMAGDAEAYGLDADTALSLAQQAVRLAKNAKLPDTPKKAKDAVEAVRLARESPGFW